jgi:glycogen operon protein
MILGGDEMGRSQSGNNNAYCQDNALAWVDWGLRATNADLFRFFRLLIRFRKAHPSLRRRFFFEDETGPPTVAWHGARRGHPDWSAESRTLAMHLLGVRGDDDIYLAANAHWEPRDFELSALLAGRTWRRAVDTSLDPPHDIEEPGTEASVAAQSAYRVGPRSVVVLVGR